MLKGGYQIIRFNPNIEVNEEPKHMMYSYYDASHTYKKLTTISGLNLEGVEMDDFHIVLDRENKDEIVGTVKCDLVNGLLLCTKLHISKDSFVHISKELMTIPPSMEYKVFNTDLMSYYYTDELPMMQFAYEITTLYNSDTTEGIIIDCKIKDVKYRRAIMIHNIISNEELPFIALNNYEFTNGISIYQKAFYSGEFKRKMNLRFSIGRNNYYREITNEGSTLNFTSMITPGAIIRDNDKVTDIISKVTNNVVVISDDEIPVSTFFNPGFSQSYRPSIGSGSTTALLNVIHYKGTSLPVSWSFNNTLTGQPVYFPSVTLTANTPKTYTQTITVNNYNRGGDTFVGSPYLVRKSKYRITIDVNGVNVYMVLTMSYSNGVVTFSKVLSCEQNITLGTSVNGTITKVEEII